MMRRIKWFLVFVASLCVIIFTFAITSSQNYGFRWWDSEWHYRVGLEINSTNYSRTNWTIEYEINFTKLLEDMNVYGEFDENSTRVIEYTSNGEIIGEIPSQFDKADDYNESYNAFGTLVFMLNGTTLVNQKRYFFVYFDIKEHGLKNKPNYLTDLSYNYTENFEELNINNSILRWWIDTERGENTSGIYHVQDAIYENNILVADPSNNRTVEYTEISNATNKFGFDLRNNATFKYVGPSRIVVEQKGYETFWNQPENKTNEVYLIKRYIFYPYTDWMKIEQIFINNATYDITRNSTVAGALSFYVRYSFGQNYPNMTNSNDPGSYAWAAEQTGTYWMGLVNIYENGTDKFFALADDETGRLGIQLTETTIPAGGYIKHIVAVQFNGSGQAGQEEYFLNFVNQSITPIQITQLEPEAWSVIVEGKFYMNATNEAYIYNRNESVIIKANVSDPYNISEKVNVTLDLGGIGEINITLYDDGTHGDENANDNIYTALYNISDNDATGMWNATFKVYNATWHLLNTTWKTFNVTNVYNVTVNITNPTGFVDRIVNATVYVRNYRGDTWITNALINCSFDGVEIPQSNISDNGDGTYKVWFKAPSYAGLFTLSCNATRNNNTGSDSDEFTCDTYTTNVSIEVEPKNFTADNVTSYANQTFNITVIAKNIANGTAHDMNITLDFSTSNITANVTFESCGEVMISKNCTKTFKIIVLNPTPKGNYTVNITATWRNSDDTIDKNSTLLNVSVLPNPILDTSTNYISGVIGAGNPLKNVANFTVSAIGNEYLTNISFLVSGFSDNFTIVFSPSNISSLGVGNSQNIEVWINATDETQPGEYNGTINVSSENDGYKIINLTIGVSGTFVALEVDKNNYTAANVTWYKNESFPLFVNITNIGNTTAYNTTIKLNFSNAGITANKTLHSCGNVAKQGTCNVSFLVTILNGTRSGNYTMNVTVEWENPDEEAGINISTINITVLSNINFEIVQTELSSNVTHGTKKEIGVLTLNSTGNDPVENISFSVYNFTSNFTFEFEPTEIQSLDGEYYQGVKVNVSVAFAQKPGIYKGKINVTTSNAGYKEVNVTIEVPVSRTWTINTTYCEKFESPEEGKVCDVLVNNTGNVLINFSITPVTNATNMFNYTWTNETNFTIDVLQSHAFSVFYNITNQEIKFYYANYTINAIQSDAEPDYVILQIVLNPFIKPIISVVILPNQTQQTGSVCIYANVTDQGGAGIGYNATESNVTVTVTRPDGTNTTIYMNFYGGVTQHGTSYWRACYPNNPYSPSQGLWGNTTMKGYYNVSVFAIDNVGNNNTESKQFLIYTKLSPFFMTTRNIYYSVIGVNTPIIFYKALDFTEGILQGVNVTFVINNSNSIVYNSSKIYGNLTTDSEGYIRDEYGSYLLSTRSLAGYPVGNYTAIAYSKYLDPMASVVVSDVSTFDFQLIESAGVNAYIFVYPVVYPAEGIVKFKMWVTDALGNLIDPLDMNLSVTMPITGNPFFNVTMSQMTKIENGVYTYAYNLPSNPSTGVYDVRLDVLGQDGTKTSAFSGFRISLGGPYDVEITLLENEVYQNDFLDFIITMKNMGDASTENLVEYWITDANNNTYAYNQFSILIDGGQEVNRTRSLPIFSYQPPGQYFLHVKLTYDINNSLSASAIASFLVIEGLPPTPPTPPPGGKAEEVAAPPAGVTPPKIEIIKYPTEFGMEVDSIKYPTVEVKNTGGVKLYNITLRIVGIPSPWILDITPKIISELDIGNSSTFTITLKIPPTAEAKEYQGKIIADANVTKDEKSFSLTIFSTRAQLIQWEIERLRKAITQLEIDTENAKKAGKDVKEVLPYIDQAKEHLRLAEDYLLKKMYDESLSEVQLGWIAVEKARYYLSIAPFVQIVFETIFPPWLIAILIVLAIALIIMAVFVKKMKAIFDRIFRIQAPGAQAATRTTVVVEKMKEREALEREEMNIRRVLALLEKQHAEGLISDSAYQSLKARNEEKLAKIQQRKAEFK